MGLDVEMDRVSTVNKLNVTQDELNLLDNYNKLNDLGKKEANKRVAELTEIIKYQKNSKNEEYSYTTMAAHDDDLTDEEKERSLDIAMKAFEEMKKNK